MQGCVRFEDMPAPIVKMNMFWGSHGIWPIPEKNLYKIIMLDHHRFLPYYLVLLLAELDKLVDARGHLRDLALEVRDLRRQRLNLRSVSSTLYPSFVIVSLSI